MLNFENVGFYDCLSSYISERFAIRISGCESIKISHLILKDSFLSGLYLQQIDSFEISYGFFQNSYSKAFVLNQNIIRIESLRKNVSISHIKFENIASDSALIRMNELSQSLDLKMVFFNESKL